MTNSSSAAQPNDTYTSLPNNTDNDIITDNNIITAASSSNDIIGQVCNASNSKGRTFVPQTSIMETMTFTSIQPTCSCDECCNQINRTKIVPESIRLAVQNHKRMKLTTTPIKRTQNRKLLRRSNDNPSIAIWHWTLPLLAEPWIEFGNPQIYRIIWVQRLHPNSVIQHIGKGIIGSRSEEQGRIILDWREDDVIFIQNEEKSAVGYIVDNKVPSSECDSSTTDPIGPAVLVIAKIPCELIPIHDGADSTRTRLEIDKQMTDSLSPFEMIRKICHRCIFTTKNCNDDVLNLIQISGNDNELFRQAVSMMTT